MWILQRDLIASILYLLINFLLQLNELEKEEAGLGATIAEMEAYAQSLDDRSQAVGTHLVGLTYCAGFREISSSKR